MLEIETAEDDWSENGKEEWVLSSFPYLNLNVV